MQGSVGKAAKQQAAGNSLVFRAAEFGDKLEHCAAGSSQRRGSMLRQRPHVVDRALRADGFASGCSQKRQIVRAEQDQRRILAEIGKRFVAENPTAPEGYAALYEQLAAVEGRIAANEARLRDLKD